ncbi:MAG: hypothetical protein HY598_03675 [Candidatus Omnitrophica bacterium]|nr:hypothetical protein [Candidatus Omnitrophota bacterium]
MSRSTVSWGLVVAVAWLLSATHAAAMVCPAPTLPGTSSCSAVNVTASVSSTASFSVTMFELVPNPATPDPTDTSIGPEVTAMAFGTLASNGTFDHDGDPTTPEQPRSLNAARAFQAFFGVNAQQRPFQVRQRTVTRLISGTNVIPDGAFIVTPLDGVGGDSTLPFPTGLTRGTRRSAISTTDITLFSRATAGPAASMAATYGITDDPTRGATEFIALDQPNGTYTTQVIFSLTIT